ncbi:TetR family transcriptional regulator [uncultured Microbacterium sp.]|uniref:TetR family transcriptional regulator n=1 Tax=uncultured Microbacterium sp. TaxID=191216 RepID=UPI0025F45528|nr:TetR family transcriptional regulator [uncultured Microbacterium sp.]
MAAPNKHSARRAELISATRRVAGREGIAGTNVRAVAAEAAVSAGSVLYYFPRFDDLLYTTAEGVLEEMYESRRRIAEAEPDPVRRLRLLVEAGVPDEISDHLRMAYESIPLLREQPQYRPLHRSIVERQVGLYRSTIEVGAALGAFHPTAELTVIARNIVALEDAYDLYALIGFDHGATTYRANILSYASVALGCDVADGEDAAPR